jgi:hypothetical protein
MRFYDNLALLISEHRLGFGSIPKTDRAALVGKRGAVRTSRIRV